MGAPRPATAPPPRKEQPVTSQNARLAAGGRIDRTTAWRFTVDGEEFTGHPGDTLASALLAAAGSPPATRSTRTGPAASSPPASRNRTRWSAYRGSRATWPSRCCRPPRSRWSTGWRRTCSRPGPARPGRRPRRVRQEVRAHRRPRRRRRSGRPGRRPRGRAHRCPRDPDRRPARAGRIAPVRLHVARAAETIEGQPALDWVADVEAELVSGAEVHRPDPHHRLRQLRRQLRHRRPEPHRPPRPAPPRSGVSRQRLWHIRAQQVVLATGAHERPLVFADNDRPGVMLASAVRTYLNRYARGRRAARGRRPPPTTARTRWLPDLRAAGVEVAAVVDARPTLSDVAAPPPKPASRC